VIDTYLSLRYICYNNCGPVYIILIFEALWVLRQWEPSSVFASGRDQVIQETFQSYQLIIM